MIAAGLHAGKDVGRRPLVDPVFHFRLHLIRTVVSERLSLDLAPPVIELLIIAIRFFAFTLMLQRPMHLLIALLNSSTHF